MEIFTSLFGIETVEKIDGFWYIIIKARKDDMEYIFEWHEDVGNCVYCLPQNRKNNKRLENELKQVLEVLNGMIKKKRSLREGKRL